MSYVPGSVRAALAVEDGRDQSEVAAPPRMGVPWPMVQARGPRAWRGRVGAGDGAGHGRNPFRAPSMAMGWSPRRRQDHRYLSSPDDLPEWVESVNDRQLVQANNCAAIPCQDAIDRRRAPAPMETSMLATIRHADRVLALFTELRPDWGVREMAAELKKPRSNVHELLSSLAGIGLLQRTPDARYRLGWRLIGLSGHLVNSNEVVQVGSDIVRDLSLRLGQTTALAVWDEGAGVYIGQVEPRGCLPIARVGDRVPAHSTASGKVLLSGRTLDPEDVLESLTPRTITDHEQLRQQLSVIARSGVAFDHGETDSSVRCISAPVRDGHSDEVVAAVTVCITPRQLDRDGERCAQATMAAARRISQRFTARSYA